MLPSEEFASCNIFSSNISWFGTMLLFHSLRINPQPLSMLCCQKQHVGLDLMASHIVCSICLKRGFFFRLMFNKTPRREETVKLNEIRLEDSLDGHMVSAI